MYKIRQNGYVLNTLTGKYFNNASYLWDGYQDWLSQGNIPEPEYNLEELRKKRIEEVSREKNKRIDQLAGDIRKKNSNMRLIASITSKKVKGITVTPDEQSALVDIEKEISDIRVIEKSANTELAWVQDLGRSFSELDNYNPEGW
jgi:hypothetical protein